MVGVATGFGARGKVPFASSLRVFSPCVRPDSPVAGISQANLKLVGSHVGVSIGEDGPSQMALEDIAMMRAVAGSVVRIPATPRARKNWLNRWRKRRKFVSCARPVRRPR